MVFWWPPRSLSEITGSFKQVRQKIVDTVAKVAEPEKWLELSRSTFCALVP